MVALIQRADGVGLVHVVFEGAGKPHRLAHCLFQPAVNPPSWDRVALELVRRCGLEKARFVGILDPTAYTLFPADAPAVPREEWALNMRWKIGDRIQYPVEQAVVEVFDLPGRTVEGDSGKIYVVVAQDTEVKRHVDLFLNAGLDLLAIDIWELALGRLTDTLEEDAQGVGVLHMAPEGGVVIVRRHQTLFLARTVETAWHDVVPDISSTAMALSMASGRHGKMGELARELRRTFDFYESNFIQPPLGVLFVTPTVTALSLDASQDASRPNEAFLVALSERLGMPVRVLPLAKRVHAAPDIQDGDLARCLPALGAALGFAPVP